MNGAGQAHRFTKEESLQIQYFEMLDNELVTEPDALMENRKKNWNAHWQAGAQNWQ